MIYMRNITITTAKSATYLENVGLQAAGLKETAEGDPRTLYSLRHTSIMFRALYRGDIDSLKFANNARTSVEMLERFYLSKMESSQFTADLHAKKPSQRQKRQTKTFYTPPLPAAPPPGISITDVATGELAPKKGDNRKVVLENGSLKVRK